MTMCGRLILPLCLNCVVLSKFQATEMEMGVAKETQFIYM